MVARNEMHRYLPDALSWLRAICGDDIVVYDDQSDDGTFEHLKSSGVSVDRRPDGVPSFAENEAAFRQAGWHAMESQASPWPGDWVLCADADEFYVADDSQDSVCERLQEAVSTAEAKGQTAVAFRVREVFGFSDDGVPLVRRDGFWGDMTVCRLVKWRPGGEFHGPPGRRGAVPSRWINWNCVAAGMSMLHFGYARASDREEKFQRYIGDYWHNPHHVESIRRPGWVERWEGALPPLRQATVT